MTTWFTADTHFGHRSILTSCARPFEDVEAMDEAMIANWNALVQPRDDVWHLGDFSYKASAARAEEIFHRLNGKKHLVRGNHDHTETQRLPWQAIEDVAMFTLDDVRLVLCHYAMRTWPRSHYGSVHLFGHSHGALPPNANSLDVGADCWDYRPVRLGQVMERLAAAVPS